MEELRPLKSFSMGLVLVSTCFWGYVICWEEFLEVDAVSWGHLLVESFDISGSWMAKRGSLKLNSFFLMNW